MRKLPPNTYVSLFVLGALVGICGCGSQDFSTAEVTGVVTCEGQTISNASILFTPIPKSSRTLAGRPATGRVGDDGSFVLTTYEKNDGAVLGKHRVTVTFPNQELPDLIPEDDEYEERGYRPRYRGKLPPCANSDKLIEVEVEPGTNHFDISLST
ncbi:hypothetical protein AB1K70_11390 [Bremerella sp. JC770]|uniref:hypothetical protein n=1 Tax=Bremerella sp. JC770 TaxID=3232137 RepID=UPI00345988A6